VPTLIGRYTGENLHVVANRGVALGFGSADDAKDFLELEWSLNSRGAWCAETPNGFYTVVPADTEWQRALGVTIADQPTAGWQWMRIQTPKLH